MLDEKAHKSIATNPACPSGIMQWQHGKYEILANGSLITLPFEVDGRQLLSEPCNYDNAIYTRYNQSELFDVRVTAADNLNHRGTDANISFSATNNSQIHITTFLDSTSSDSTARQSCLSTLPTSHHKCFLQVPSTQPQALVAHKLHQLVPQNCAFDVHSKTLVLPDKNQRSIGHLLTLSGGLELVQLALAPLCISASRQALIDLFAGIGAWHILGLHV